VAIVLDPIKRIDGHSVFLAWWAWPHFGKKVLEFLKTKFNAASSVVFISSDRRIRAAALCAVISHHLRSMTKPVTEVSLGGYLRLEAATAFGFPADQTGR
jgi:hypothetical protein